MMKTLLKMETFETEDFRYVYTAMVSKEAEYNSFGCVSVCVM